MASLWLVCVVLFLRASSRAQESAAGGGEQPPPPIVAEKPAEVTEKPAEVTEKPAEVAEKTMGTTTPQPAAIIPTPVVISLTTPAPEIVEDPQVAAKQVEGSPALDKTPLVAEPDAIKKVLGSKCSGTSDCESIPNTKCIDGVCICNTAFIPSKHSLDKCIILPSGLGDDCEEEMQCSHVVTDSECRDNKCQCPLNYVHSNAKCWEKQVLGSACSNSAQCEDITFATCAQGVCTCELPLIPSPINKCLQPAEKVYRAACVEDIQCSHSYGDEARCSNGQCRCTNNYHYNGTNCIADRGLGTECDSDDDCAVSDLKHIEGSRMCAESKCACATGFQTLSGEEICTRSSAEELAVSLTWIVCIVLAKYYLV